MPAVNTKVSASMLPLRRFATISSWVTGPTWWPPMAIYHCCVDISESRLRGQDEESGPDYGLGCRGGVDARGGDGLEARRCGRVDPELVGELSQVDALASGHGLVCPQDGERQRVQLV